MPSPLASAAFRDALNRALRRGYADGGEVDDTPVDVPVDDTPVDTGMEMEGDDARAWRRRQHRGMDLDYGELNTSPNRWSRRSKYDTYGREGTPYSLWAQRREAAHRVRALAEAIARGDYVLPIPKRSDDSPGGAVVGDRGQEFLGDVPIPVLSDDDVYTAIRRGPYRTSFPPDGKPLPTGYAEGGYADGGRTYMPFQGDYQSYGQGPEALFFDNASSPLDTGAGTGTSTKTPTSTVNPQALADNAISGYDAAVQAALQAVEGGQAGPQGSAPSSVSAATQSAIGGLSPSATAALGAVAGLAPGIGTAVALGNAINSVMGPTPTTQGVSVNGLSTGNVGVDAALAEAASIASSQAAANAAADAVSNAPGQGIGGIGNGDAVGGPDSSGQAAGSDSNANFADGGRVYQPFSGDYSTYGQGPEALFFTDAMQAAPVAGVDDKGTAQATPVSPGPGGLPQRSLSDKIAMAPEYASWLGSIGYNYGQPSGNMSLSGLSGQDDATAVFNGAAPGDTGVTPSPAPPTTLADVASDPFGLKMQQVRFKRGGAVYCDGGVVYRRKGAL